MKISQVSVIVGRWILIIAVFCFKFITIPLQFTKWAGKNTPPPIKFCSNYQKNLHGLQISSRHIPYQGKAHLIKSTEAAKTCSGNFRGKDMTIIFTMQVFLYKKYGNDGTRELETKGLRDGETGSLITGH